MIYFISDTHFGHENIIRYCNRPFDSVEQMNKTLIEKWNNKVTDEDEIYIVGDMFYRCDDAEVEKIIKALKGKKHLYLGNHDESWDYEKYANYFEDINQAGLISIRKHHAFLCHYPVMETRCSYMIHGHIHNEYDVKEKPYKQLLIDDDSFLNVSADILDFTPATFDEILRYNQITKEKYKKDIAK